MNAAQAAALRAQLHRASLDPQRSYLPQRHDAPLSLGELSERQIEACCFCEPCLRLDSTHARIRPRCAPGAAPSGTLPRCSADCFSARRVVARPRAPRTRARQAFTPTAVTAAPADTQAGANSNFSLHFGVEDPSHDLKAFTIHLPPGEVGAVTATPLCTQAQFAAKACPANTQVGTTTTHATAFPTPLTGIAVDVPGKLYNLAPVGPEPARLGIRLTPAIGDEILLQSIVTVRPADGGLDSSTDGLPRTSALGDIDVNAVDITLFGEAGDPAKGFVSNPTSCAPATTTVDAVAYDGAQGSGSASFTPTGCDKLAFAPTLSATLNPGAKAGRPTLTTVVESPPGQANARTVQITLPAGLGAVVTTLNHACPEDVFNQGACAPNADDRQRQGRDAGARGPARGARRPGQARGLAAAQARHRPARPDRPDPPGQRRLRSRRAPAVDARRPARHRAEPLHADPRRRRRRPAVQRARPVHRAHRARRRELRRPERRDLELVGDPADRGLPAAGQRQAQGPALAPSRARAALQRRRWASA